LAPFILITVGLMALAKNWNQIWSDIQRWTAEAVLYIQGVPDKIVSFFEGLPDRMLGSTRSGVVDGF